MQLVTLQDSRQHKATPTNRKHVPDIQIIAKLNHVKTNHLESSIIQLISHSSENKASQNLQK